MKGSIILEPYQRSENIFENMLAVAIIIIGAFETVSKNIAKNNGRLKTPWNN